MGADSLSFEMLNLCLSQQRSWERYYAAYRMLYFYNIEEARELLESKEHWTNTEPFLHHWSNSRITVVHLAACRGDLALLKRAKDLQASLLATDEFGRSALHFAASEGYVDIVNCLFERSDEQPHPQLSLPDDFGWTPLHHAVRELHVATVKLLVSAGADVNAVHEQSVSPLLMAHVNVSKKSHSSISQYEKIIDILTPNAIALNVEHPTSGWTPLHHAADLNSLNATEKLIRYGAYPRCSHSGKTTPVHIAARSGYREVLSVLLKFLPATLIDSTNEDGWSSLHLAAVNGNLSCVSALLEKGANLAKETPDGDTACDLLSMFNQDANLVSYFTNIFDAKIRLVEKLRDEAQTVYIINFDFGILAPSKQPQMAVISAMIKALLRREQTVIFQHPLLQIYLRDKWSRLMYLFYFNVMCHCIYVSYLSFYAVILLREGFESAVLRRILLCYSLSPFGYHLLRLLRHPSCHCRRFENWLTLTCASLSIVIAIAGEFQSRSAWIPHLLSIAILLSCTQIMLLAGRFPAWGFYALVFFTVLKNGLKVLFISFWIIVGFTLSFAVLFHSKEQFRGPIKAFVKTMVMMTGEYDYDDLFHVEGKTNATTPHFDYDENWMQLTSQIIFLVFVMLASVVLMNLMIGLAVSDIQGLMTEGQFNRLLKQAEFITDCERMTISRLFWTISLPGWLTNVLNSSIEIKPNQRWYWGRKRRPNISKKLWMDLFKLVLKNKKSNPTAGDDCKIRRTDAVLEGLKNEELYSNCAYIQPDDHIYEVLDG